MSHLFIAYGPHDLDAVLQVHESLRRESIPTWYVSSQDDVAAESPAVMEAIDDAFGVVVLVSASAMRSRAVQKQVQRALDRGVKLFPIRADNARLTRFFKDALADQLTDSVHDEGGTERLIDKVRARYLQRCPVVAVMNLKGGVGKTTISAQVFGAWQAALGGRVLLIDLDPQYNLTQTFFDMSIADASAAEDRSVISLFERSRLHSGNGHSPAEDWTSISTEPFNVPERDQICHDLLVGDGPAGRLDLISGQFEISKYAFASKPEALAMIGANFRRMIDSFRSQYDLIVFDTNPNATFLTRCALEAADRVVAPMHPDVYSLRGVRLLSHVIDTMVADVVRPQLSVLFNAVSRSEQSDFEADARNGVYDDQAEFALSKALLTHAVPRSSHLIVRKPELDAKAWQQLLIHHGRGGGLKKMRDTLVSVAQELSDLLVD